MRPRARGYRTMGSKPKLARALTTAAGRRDGEQHSAQAAMFGRQRVVGGGGIRLEVSRGALGQAAQFRPRAPRSESRL
jgi:hypothetical protein